MGRFYASRALAALGLFAAAYPVVFVALWLLKLVQPHDGLIDGHVLPAAVAAAFAAAALGIARQMDGSVLRHPVRGSADHPAPFAWSGTPVLAGLLGVLGLLAAGFGLYLLVGVLWYELTYFEQGGVGVSFGVISLVFAYLVPLPAAALLLAGAATTWPRRTVERPIGDPRDDEASTTI